MTTKKTDSSKRNISGAIKQSMPEKITTEIDPHLQEVILQREAGDNIDSRFSESLPDGTVTIDVIAKLDDPQKSVKGLQVVRMIGQIVTGKVNIRDIEAVRAHSNVLSLKRATRLHKQLNFSVPEIRADKDALAAGLPDGAGPIDGSGVILGVIDYGCDFRHGNFRNADGTTRLLYIWDQRGGDSTLSPAGFGYGREFDSTAINQALQQPNPYLALKYDPGKRSHGTHVMDIAAGNGRATLNPGVAPGADLIFVNIAHDDINIDEIEEGKPVNFGNSKMLLEAADYVFVKAAELGAQAVINISLGTHGGPHDGSTLAEQGMDTLLEQPGRAISISAGNSWDSHSHASGSITKDTPRSLGWDINPRDLSRNELEVWYGRGSQISVSLTTPSGQKLAPVEPGPPVTLTNSANEVLGRIFHRISDPNNSDNHINILLEPGLPGGVWKINLATRMQSEVRFHAWIERDDPNRLNPRAQSRFVDADDDRSHTIGSISCGRRTIAVGSYLSGLPSLELSPFSAEGPTRDGKQKPEVSAPGQYLHPYWKWGVQAANSRTQGATRKSGTSMASPHVAGLIALLMQASGRELTINEIREAIMDTARQNPPSGASWHSRYGFGRVDALATIVSQRPDIPFHHATSDGMPPKTALRSFEDGSNDLKSLLLATAEAANQTRSKVSISIEVNPV